MGAFDMSVLSRILDESVSASKSRLEPAWLPFVDKKVVVTPHNGKKMTGILRDYQLDHPYLTIKSKPTRQLTAFADYKSVVEYDNVPTILNASQIIRGHTYRSSRPRSSPLGNDDRYVVYVCQGEVQYNSDTVRNGARYPMVPMVQFLRWAAKDVTEEYQNKEAK